VTEVLDSMYKSTSLYNLECSPYYWLIQSEESFIDSSLLLLLMKVLQHLKITIAISENKIYLKYLDLRNICRKGFDPGVWQICQQCIVSLPIICLLLLMWLKKNEQKFARLTTTWPFGVLKPWTEFQCAGHGPQNTSDLESNSLPTP